MVGLIDEKTVMVNMNLRKLEHYRHGRVIWRFIIEQDKFNLQYHWGLNLYFLNVFDYVITWQHS